VYFICTVMRWTSMNVFRAPFFHHAALYSFSFPFRSLLDMKKKQTRIFIRHSPFTEYFFFSFFFGEFFPSMSQCLCSNGIVQIHHVFSLLVHMIFRFSSDPSLIYRFMYAYLKDCCFSVFFL